MKETQNIQVCQFMTIEDGQQFPLYYLEPTCKIPNAIHDWIVTRHFAILSEADEAAEKVSKMIQDSMDQNKDWYEAIK